MRLGARHFLRCARQSDSAEQIKGEIRFLGRVRMLCGRSILALIRLSIDKWRRKGPRQLDQFVVDNKDLLVVPIAKVKVPNEADWDNFVHKKEDKSRFILNFLTAVFTRAGSVLKSSRMTMMQIYNGGRPRSSPLHGVPGRR